MKYSDNLKIDEDKIIGRYLQLNKAVRSMLTDYYNSFVGLNMLAYGNEFQFNYAKEICLEAIQQGRNPVNSRHVSRDRIDKDLEASLSKKDGLFSNLDVLHLKELDEIVDNLNREFREHDIKRQNSRTYYDAIVVYLYGKRPSV